MTPGTMSVSKLGRTLRGLLQDGGLGRVHIAGRGAMPAADGQRVPPRDNHALAACLAGQAEFGFWRRGRWSRQALAPGDVIHRPPGTWLVLYLSAPYRSVGCVFDEGACHFHFAARPGAAGAGALAKSPYLVRSPGPRAAGVAAARLLDSLAEGEADDALRGDLLRAVLRTLTERVADDAAPAAGQAEASFRALCAFVSEHADQPLDRAAVAEAMQLSPTHVSRLFAQFGESSFVEFLRNERLSHARLLLADPRLSVSEVAYRVGFSSPNYFVRCFRQKHGQTPGAYRRQTMR